MNKFASKYKECQIISLPLTKNKAIVKDFIDAPFCKNKDGVINKMTNEEDVLQSLKWFANWPQHIYILSDDKIRKGDWSIELESKKIVKCTKNLQVHIANNAIRNETKTIFKIIATTDPELNIFRIPILFIEEYIKKPVESVIIEYIPDGFKAYPEQEGPECFWFPKVNYKDFTIEINTKTHFTFAEVRQLMQESFEKGSYITLCDYDAIQEIKSKFFDYMNDFIDKKLTKYE